MNKCLNVVFFLAVLYFGDATHTIAQDMESDFPENVPAPALIIPKTADPFDTQNLIRADALALELQFKNKQAEPASAKGDWDRNAALVYRQRISGNLDWVQTMDFNFHGATPRDPWGDRQADSLLVIYQNKLSYEVKKNLSVEGFAWNQQRALADAEMVSEKDGIGLSSSFGWQGAGSVTAGLKQEFSRHTQEWFEEQDTFWLEGRQQLGAVPVTFSFMPALSSEKLHASGSQQPLSQTSRLTGTMQYQPTAHTFFSTGSTFGFQRSEKEVSGQNARTLFTEVNRRIAPGTSLSFRADYDTFQIAPETLLETEKEALMFSLSPSFSISEDFSAKLEFQYRVEDRAKAALDAQEGRVSFTFGGSF